MNVRKSHTPSRPVSRGFTLLEVLVVMGIILILISITVPIVGKVRIASQTANTKQMLARLEAGIQQYFDTFQAYPGPFFTPQLKPFTAAAPVIDNPVISDVNLTVGLVAPALTSSETLYVSLVGGLNVTLDTTLTPTQIVAFNYDPTIQSTNGPMNLGPTIPKRFPAMVQASADETTFFVRNPAYPALTAGEWNSASGGFVGDSQVPEFLDKYSSPSPILYMRANRGATSFYSSRTGYVVAAEGVTQYQVAQVFTTYAGVKQEQGTIWTIDTADYLPEPSDNVTIPSGPTVGTTPGAFKYFGNPDVNTSQPLKKDEYILISAGPDGKYGTSDDVTNFRNR